MPASRGGLAQIHQTAGGVLRPRGRLCKGCAKHMWPAGNLAPDIAPPQTCQKHWPCGPNQPTQILLCLLCLAAFKHMPKAYPNQKLQQKFQCAQNLPYVCFKAHRVYTQVQKFLPNTHIFLFLCCRNILILHINCACGICVIYSMVTPLLGHYYGLGERLTLIIQLC